MPDEQTKVVGETLGARVTHARVARGIKGPAELARRISNSGVKITRQAIAAIERDAVDTPRQVLLEAMAEVLGLTVEELLHGPRAGDTLFVAQVRGLEGDLSTHQRDQILYLANEMAKETRVRREEEAARKRADLSVEEAELLRLYRQMTPGVQKRLLQVAGSEEEPRRRQGGQRQAG